MYAHSRPNRGSKWTHNLLKNGRNLTRNILLKVNYQDEVHLDASSWIYILTIYRECFFFSSLDVAYISTSPS